MHHIINIKKLFSIFNSGIFSNIFRKFNIPLLIVFVNDCKITEFINILKKPNNINSPIIGEIIGVIIIPDNDISPNEYKEIGNIPI